MLRPVEQARHRPSLIGRARDHAILPEPAAEAARAAGVAAQLAPPEDERAERLDDLGGHARDARRESRRAEPVLAGARAHATELEDRLHEGTAAAIASLPDRDPERVGRAGEQAIGNGVRQGAEDDARQEVPDHVARRDRRRMLAVEDRAQRRRHVHGPERAVVVRHLGRDRRLHRVGRVRVRVVEHQVDAERLCGELPAQSTVISSPATVTVQRSTIGSSKPSVQRLVRVDARRAARRSRRAWRAPSAR